MIVRPGFFIRIFVSSVIRPSKSLTRSSIERFAFLYGGFSCAVVVCHCNPETTTIDKTIMNPENWTGS